MSRVRIPADVDRADRILGGLTARQLGILGVAGLVLGVAYLATRAVLPLAAFAAFAAPVAAGAAALALGRLDGLSGDRLALAALGQARSPRRLVPVSDAVVAPPPWIARGAGPAPEPLRLPARGIDEAGVLDLGPEGSAVLCAASSINLGLRSDAEQDAVVGAFGRFLNSLSTPLQVVVRSERVDLRAAVTELTGAAGALPHPALEQAALEHARFLAELAARHDVLRRQVLVVLRDRRGADVAGPDLVRRAESARTALGAAGISVRRLDAVEALSVLARAADPDSPHVPTQLAHSAAITGRKP